MNSVTAVIGLTGAQKSKYWSGCQRMPGDRSHTFGLPTFSWKLTSSGKAPSIRMGMASGSRAAFAGKFNSNQRTSFCIRGYGNRLAKCTAREGFSAHAVRTRG